MTTYTLDHKKLDIYEHALAFGVKADAMANAMRGRRGDLANQLRRASASIVCNTAEGAGEFSPDAKANFYRIARRSAIECCGILDLASRLGLVTEPYEGDVARIVAGLVRLTQSVEQRNR